jgi:hypothetical protein
MASSFKQSCHPTQTRAESPFNAAPPQVFRVSQRFFDIIGVMAPPSRADSSCRGRSRKRAERSSAHTREEAFDGADCTLMLMLADFVTPGNALSAMAEGAAGRLSRIGGEWWIFPAYWQGPTFSFDENQLTDTITWEGYKSYSELVNQVTGTYTAPNFPYAVAGDLYDSNGFFQGQIQNNFSFGWQTTSFPYYAQDVLHGYPANQFQIDDGGQVLPKDISLPTVISITQAQRVGKINLLMCRQQGSGTFPMSLAAWQMQPCDVMQFSFAENGWVDKNLEIIGVAFKVADADQSGVQSVRCEMQVQEASSVYEWNATDELTVYCKPAAVAA